LLNRDAILPIPQTGWLIDGLHREDEGNPWCSWCLGGETDCWPYDVGCSGMEMETETNTAQEKTDLSAGF
jgi:hypothetical protein